jgi:hypothetical protein
MSERAITLKLTCGGGLAPAMGYVIDVDASTLNDSEWSEFEALFECAGPSALTEGARDLTAYQVDVNFARAHKSIMFDELTLTEPRRRLKKWFEQHGARRPLQF